MEDEPRGKKVRNRAVFERAVELVKNKARGTYADDKLIVVMDRQDRISSNKSGICRRFWTR